MAENIYYHNPRCSKSRQGLSLLEEKNVTVSVKEYLKEGFTQSELKDLFKALELPPGEVVRKKDDLYKEVVSDPTKLSQNDWIELILKNPALMERPILRTPKGAKIGRPPENLLEII